MNTETINKNNPLSSSRSISPTSNQDDLIFIQPSSIINQSNLLNSTTTSPLRKSKNLKNLQLNLSSDTNSNKVLQLNSPRTPLYRKPSLNQSPTPNNSPLDNQFRRRSKTLALTIPNKTIQQPSSSNEKLRSNTISNDNDPQIHSSSSPLIIPQTINHNLSLQSITSDLNSTSLNSTTTTTTTTQQQLDSISNYNYNYKNAYPNGPICVLEPNLYLYSEPTINQILEFDLIINVAMELTNYTEYIIENNNNNNNTNNNLQYLYIPWTHTSRLINDFPKLTKLINDSLLKNKKILIHCQCGVSRSASLILAYFMKFFKIGYIDAYNMLKLKAPKISPNMTLIYELMEWGKLLGFTKSKDDDDDDDDDDITTTNNYESEVN